ncbi:MAG: lipopolysaccharide biosynthesis protein [Acidobacteriia bacterium]|nr:lipopolysaccharide biosynthesis protein [Terriglobia bacterium]
MNPLPQVRSPELEARKAELQPIHGPQAVSRIAPANEQNVARLRQMWDQRRLLLRCAAAGLMFFTVVAFLIPARYDSTTRLMPPDASGNAGTTLLAALAGRNDALAGLSTDMLGLKSSGALFVGVLQSRSVEDALVRRFDLRKVYWDRRWEDARKDLESYTTISEDRKNGIISIRVRDRSPERAQAMSKAYVEELDRAVATVATSSARREREFLETRLKAVKQDLDQAANDFSQFASKNTAIDIPAQGKAMVEAAARLQGELIAAESEQRGLEQVYTANNVRVRSVQARIGELRRQLDKMGGKDVGPGETTDSSDDSLYPSIRKLPLLGVTYADLYRRTKIEEAVYETLTKQYELAKVQEAKEIPTVKVLDPPSYPERKASPARLVIMFLGMLFSVAAGGGWILGRAVWTETDPQDPRKIFAQDVVAGLKRDSRGLQRRIAQIRKRGGTRAGLGQESA